MPVQLVLARLPDHYRVPLVLRYIEGFSTADIARRHRLAPPAV